MTTPRRAMTGLLLVSVFLVFLGCNDSPTDPGGLDIGFETVLKGPLPGISPDSEGQQAVRDRATWQAVWTEIHGGASVPLPDVDFGREMVIVILGPGCNGDTTISSIVRGRDELEVKAKTRSCINALCIIADFSLHVVRLPRFEGPVRFNVQQGGGLC